MKRVLPALAMLLVLAGCGSNTSASATPTPYTLVKHASVSLIFKPSLGTEALSDTRTGKTLYRFTADAKSHSATCVSPACMQTWRPEQDVQGVPALPHGVKGVFDITDRRDGTSQLTYNGWPLYYYTGDTSPGDAKGQGLDGQWFAVTAATQTSSP